ncbi:MAG TPA: glycosyltransferase family 87 protein [Blastocatellia bacterium]|nr:glycosyltransferase family 87 protein [Blastocatellia bacterium]
MKDERETRGRDVSSIIPHPFIVAALITAIALLGFVFIRNLIDFPVYYSAGRSLLGGRTDLYAPDFARGSLMDYRYPPFFLIALAPLWFLPYKPAAYVWYLLSVAEIIGCLLILRSLVNPNRAKLTWLIAFLATGQYFVMILHYGNAHLPAIFLLFASVYLYIKRKDSLAALAMSLAVTIKLTPILLLPYFALKKRWRFLSLVSGFLIIINLAPALYFGFEKNSELLVEWYNHVVADQEFHETNGPINLSLKGELRRYLSPVDYSQRVEADTDYRNINVAALSREQTDRIWLVVAAIVYGVALALVLWRSKGIKGHEEAGISQRVESDGLPLYTSLEFGLMISVMLLVGPLTSKIYFIALLWPIVSLGSFAFNDSLPASGLARRVLLVIAAINFVLPLLPGRSLQRFLLVLGADFFVNCILMAALASVLIANRRVRQEQSYELRTQALP